MGVISVESDCKAKVQREGTRAAVERDGNYVLEVTYHDDRELVLDVLRHGAEVEVVGPTGLRARVLKSLNEATAPYSNESANQ